MWLEEYWREFEGGVKSGYNQDILLQGIKTITKVLLKILKWHGSALNQLLHVLSL